MKTIITFYLSALVSLGYSQVTKGTWLLSANSNFSFTTYSSKFASSNPSIFVINSKFGYFLANNFALGVNLGYISVGSGGSGSATNATTAGLFGRAFLGRNFFLGTGYTFASYSSSSGSYSTIPSEVGFAAFVSPNFAIEPSISYVVATDNQKGGVPVFGIPNQGTTSSFGLNIAFTFYLNRNQN